LPRNVSALTIALLSAVTAQAQAHNIPGLNSLRYFLVLAPEIMNSPSPR
jgi:hypothetical protein